MSVIVTGASNQIGAYLIPQLLANHQTVFGLSRSSRPPWIAEHKNLRWVQHDLQEPLELRDAHLLVQAGPLDLSVKLFAANRQISRVMAFSTTSVITKAQSLDPKERRLVEVISEAESALVETAEARRAPYLICRPTIVYGAGLDQGLSNIARMLRRFPVFPLPFGGGGRRQPVHAQDLADLACGWILGESDAIGTYATPGGETLTYRQMVQRIRNSMDRGARIATVPAWVLKATLGTAHRLGKMRSITSAMLDRMREDLVFDGSPAQVDLAFQPRPFQPDAACWDRPSQPLIPNR